MDDDVIVVDDELADRHPPSPAEASAASPGSSSYAGRSMRTPRAPTMHPSMETSARTTRAALARAKPQPKLRLKLSDKAAAQAPGMSFLGPYDRELDSDDDDLAFEEQFILRMPPGEDCERLRRMVAARDVAGDVWFKFKDARRAVFHIGNATYAAKLVDLPCIVESQKTLDNKQMFKVADICQMLVVEHRIDGDEPAAAQKSFNIEEFIWPHGLTPPLHHVRKRRFRKRVNRRTIESVEQAVERLLQEDEAATEVKYEILENVNPDLSDSEFIERDEPLDAPTPAPGSDAGDAPTPGMGDGEEDEEDEADEPEGDIDEELAAELDLALGDEDEGDEGDDEDDESEEDESEDEDDEAVQARKLLNEEIRDLEAAVAKKGAEIASSANPLIKKRFEDALKKLAADLEMKLAQRDEMKEQQRMKKEGISMDTDHDTDPDGGGQDGGDGEGDAGPGGDLFGSDDAPIGMAMDIG